jgi:UDP-glucose 4-epimerase
MADYLVTGAAGFIGASVARRLLEEGHRVVIIDNLSTGCPDNVPEGADFFEARCQDEAVYHSIPQLQYEAIYHLAGQSSGEISFDDPVYDLQTNTQSTLLLLRYALEVGCRKFLYASSMSVYGDQPDGPVSESAELAPKSFYGVGKLASEHYMRLYANLGIDCTSLRLFNVYGPGQNMANMRQGMVSIFLSQALESQRVHVKGSGDRFRDLVYIDDVVEAFLRAEELIKPGCAVFNIGTGIRTTVASLIEEIRTSVPFEFTVEFEGSTLGDQHGIFSDCSQAAGVLGWRAVTSLSQGTQQMVEWAMSNMSAS